MIYVSGRVVVSNIDHFRSQFQSAKDYLLHEVWVYEDRDIYTLIQLYDDVMAKRDISDYLMSEEFEDRIKLVKNCERLYLLQGWDYDEMCKVEHTVAKAYRIPITYSKKF